MAKVILVNPQVVNCQWGSGRRPRNMEEALPRHSLTHLSATLKQKGHTVSLLDLRLLSGWNEYEQVLRRERPDFICVTAHTLEAEVAIQCMNRAKHVLPDSITVAGGIHFSMYPHSAIDAGCSDFVVRGEGEVTLPYLIEHHRAFPRISWGEPPDLDALPFEDRELYHDYPLRSRFPLWDLPTPIIDILTGRGCPWRCRFCCGPGEKNLYTKPSPHREGKRIPFLRRRSVDHVMAELAELHRRYGFLGLVIHDDQFLIKERWVDEFCERMHRDGFVKRGVQWWAASRADLICRYPEVLKAMKKAGLKIISIGFESFSDEILAWLDKGVDRHTNMQAASICRELGIDIYANVIFGIPREDGTWHIEDDLISMDAIKEIHPRYFSPSFLSPIPGSWLYDWALRSGLLKGVSPMCTGSRTLNQWQLQGVDYAKLALLVRWPHRSLTDPLKERLGYYSYVLDDLECWRALKETCSDLWKSVKGG